MNVYASLISTMVAMSPITDVKLSSILFMYSSTPAYRAQVSFLHRASVRAFIGAMDMQCLRLDLVTILVSRRFLRTRP
jgi:hypothetical protein